MEVYYNENVNKAAAAPQSCLRFYYDGIITNVFEEDASTHIVPTWEFVWHWYDIVHLRCEQLNSKMRAAAFNEAMLGNKSWCGSAHYSKIHVITSHRSGGAGCEERVLGSRRPLKK